MNNKTFDLYLIGFKGFGRVPLGSFIEDQLDYDLENLDDSFSKLHIENFECWQKMGIDKYRSYVADMLMDSYVERFNSICHNVINLNLTGKCAKVVYPHDGHGVEHIYKQIEISQEEYKTLVKYISDNRYNVVTECDLINQDPMFCMWYNRGVGSVNYWCGIKWEDLTSTQLSFMLHCVLCSKLLSNGKEKVNEVFDTFMQELYDNIYYDLDFGYGQYVDWDLYHKELKSAFDREKVKYDGMDVLDDALWVLVDMYKIDETNRLVLKKEV